MHNIRQRSLDEIVCEQVINNRIPLLGICLGMQLLATKDWEGKETSGLGLIDGEVCRLESTDEGTRIPHIGWNDVVIEQESHFFTISQAEKISILSIAIMSAAPIGKTCSPSHPIVVLLPRLWGMNTFWGSSFILRRARRWGFNCCGTF